MIDYNNRRFRTLRNSESGEVSDATTFHYYQDGKVLWAEYAGGLIVKGHIIGTVSSSGEIDMAYQHLNSAGELRTGTCHSVPERLADGRLILNEYWQWTNGESGTSLIEEF
ncbi:MAG: n-acetylglutamate synthase [Siphonobacter sp.]